MPRAGLVLPPGVDVCSCEEVAAADQPGAGPGKLGARGRAKPGRGGDKVMKKRSVQASQKDKGTGTKTGEKGGNNKKNQPPPPWCPHPRIGRQAFLGLCRPPACEAASSPKVQEGQVPPWDPEPHGKNENLSVQGPRMLPQRFWDSVSWGVYLG